jgi:lipopolysaccharide biosynthesis glycosyltransferase
MDIAFAFDEAYVDHAQVAIESILECHQHRSDITFWLVTTAQVAAERACSLHMQTDGRAKLRLLTTDDEFRAMPVPAHGIYRNGIYLRLRLPHLVPRDVDRLLYLDCDILVHRDLGSLWEVQLGDALLAAVRDGINRTMGDWGGVPGMAAGIRRDAPYFNSGVLLMNLPVWRCSRATERCVEYLREHHDRLRFPDQDALNLVGYDAWLELESSWNDTVRWWQTRADDATDEQVHVTHFVGPRKPWQVDFPVDRYRDRYLELAARLPRPAGLATHSDAEDLAVLRGGPTPAGRVVRAGG